MVAAGGIEESMLGVKDSRSIGFRPIGLLKMSSLDNCNHFLTFPWCNAKGCCKIQILICFGTYIFSVVL